jgi:hypothetical protein
MLGVCLVGLGLLWAGAVPCLTAKWFHVPCPGCGSTRSTKALLSLDFAGVIRFNPLGPIMAALCCLILISGVVAVARDGNLSAVGQGRMGRLLVRTLLFFAGLELVVWVLRFFGLFGGPCPV